MSVLAEAADPAPQPARSQLFWAVLGALVVGQLFAFWLLCSHQVRLAQARQNEQAVQQMALADCLQSIPRSTIASCSGQSGGAGADAAQVGMTVNPAAPGAQPVSFNYR